MRSRTLLLVVLTTAGLLGCTSPEATRTRGGGPGADPGNRGQVVRMHDGSEPYYGTPRIVNIDRRGSTKLAGDRVP